MPLSFGLPRVDSGAIRRREVPGPGGTIADAGIAPHDKRGRLYCGERRQETPMKHSVSRSGHGRRLPCYPPNMSCSYSGVLTPVEHETRVAAKRGPTISLQESRAAVAGRAVWSRRRPHSTVWITSNPSNSGWPRYRGRLPPALRCAWRNASDVVQSSNAVLSRQIVCDEYSTWSSRAGPRNRWNDTKPGTPRKWVSREVQTSSNDAPASS